MKRVLIITYYWPPSGGSGVQRWLKMSKYLPEYGWQPVIYTPEEGEYPILDPSLEKDVAPEAEVIKRPIVEPYNLYKRFLGIKKEQKIKAGFIDETGKQKGWKERLSIWIRGNLFIPDARCWWVKPSVHYLKEYLKAHPVDAIISTGPPHSMHLIAMKLKEDLGIPWIADFRDPWTEIYYYKELRLTKWADRKQHDLEREVLTKADKVVTVSPDGARRLGQLGNRNVRIVYNGFDYDDDSTESSEPQSKEFVITFVGVITKLHNPYCLWQVLEEFINTDQDFSNNIKINLIGQVDNTVKDSIKAYGLEQKVTYTSYIPHDQVAKVNRRASLLLVLLIPSKDPKAKGLLSGKLFEYLVSGRPILCLGPEDGDAAHILEETQAGYAIEFDNITKLREVIWNYYQDYLNHTPFVINHEKIEKYSRKSLAGDYVKLLNNLITEKRQITNDTNF